jgi:hypothetical protein
MSEHDDKMILTLELGQRMRAVQKKFFAGDRTQRVVAEAKKLEKEFDEKVAYVLALVKR